MTNNPAVHHVIVDEPLRCFGQMMTAWHLTEAHGATLHLTAACAGNPRRKHPGMGSGCMPLDPVRGGDRCRHDVAALRAGGAIDIGADTPCWTPDGGPCPTCSGAADSVAAPLAPLPGALW